METVDYVKTNCPNCGGSFEFPAHAIGEETECPHCQKQIKLTQLRLPRCRSWMSKVLGVDVKWVQALCTLALISTALWIYADYKGQMLMQSATLESIDKQLQSLDVSISSLADDVFKMELTLDFIEKDLRLSGKLGLPP